MEARTYWGEEMPFTTLTFFVLPQDSDGIDDIDEIQLYHDAQGLYWTLTANDWVSVKDGDNTWLGAYDITMPDSASGSASPPSGQYRAVIIDKAGEQSESGFGFDFDPLRYKFPVFETDLAAKTYTVDTTYPALNLVCYDSQGGVVSTVPLPQKSGSLASLSLGANITSVSLWAVDSEHFCSALTEAKPVR
jgi:hypothetical protein